MVGRKKNSKVCEWHKIFVLCSLPQKNFVLLDILTVTVEVAWIIEKTHLGILFILVHE